MTLKIFDPRKEVLNYLVGPFLGDKKLLLLAGDMGFGAIDRLAKKCPSQVINMGIMEQGAIGIAAGMAIIGLRPVVYSIVTFLAFRCLEQVRLDLVQQQLNVKLLGTGAEDHFEHLGASHCCGSDDVKIMKLVGMKVFDAYDGEDIDFSELVWKWIEYEGPAYLRV